MDRESKTRRAENGNLRQRVTAERNKRVKRCCVSRYATQSADRANTVQKARTGKRNTLRKLLRFWRNVTRNALSSGRCYEKTKKVIQRFLVSNSPGLRTTISQGPDQNRTPLKRKPWLSSYTQDTGTTLRACCAPYPQKGEL